MSATKPRDENSEGVEPPGTGAERRRRKPRIGSGSLLIVHRDETGRGGGLRLIVERIEHDLVWIKGTHSEIRPGDMVLVEQPVAGDARYVNPAEIEVMSPEHFALRFLGSWERLQQRAYVRISTPKIELSLARPGEQEKEADERTGRRGRRRQPREPERYQMLDLSAGGTRFRARGGGFRVGDDLVCSFELPESSCFELLGQVVNVEDESLAPNHRPWVAVRFTNIDESSQASLMSWIFYEQVQRHLKTRGRLES